MAQPAGYEIAHGKLDLDFTFAVGAINRTISDG